MTKNEEKLSLTQTLWTVTNLKTQQSFEFSGLDLVYVLGLTQAEVYHLRGKKPASLERNGIKVEFKGLPTKKTKINNNERKTKNGS